MDTLNIGDIKNAKLSAMKIHKATIHDSELRNVEVYNCTIYDSTFFKSKMFDCNIFKSKFKSCELHGVKLVKCDFDDVIVKPASPCLSKLPVEVREMIFELVLDDYWLGVCKAHPFLAALRGTTELYMQAVEIFNKLNTFPIDYYTENDHGGGNAINSLSKIARLRIKKLFIDCDVVDLISFGEAGNSLSTLTDLTLDMSWLVREYEFKSPGDYDVIGWINTSLNAIKTLKKLFVSTPSIPPITHDRFAVDPDLYGTIQEPKWVDAIQFVSSKLGIEVQVIDTLDWEDLIFDHPLADPEIYDYGEIVWLWEAKRSETLKWKE